MKILRFSDEFIGSDLHLNFDFILGESVLDFNSELQIAQKLLYHYISSFSSNKRIATFDADRIVAAISNGVDREPQIICTKISIQIGISAELVHISSKSLDMVI